MSVDLLYSYQTPSDIRIPVAVWLSSLSAILKNIFLGVHKSSDNLCKTGAKTLVIATTLWGAVTRQLLLLIDVSSFSRVSRVLVYRRIYFVIDRPEVAVGLGRSEHPNFQTILVERLYEIILDSYGIPITGRGPCL